jgi:glycosyltransferase involved in cell wall biosynthesis
VEVKITYPTVKKKNFFVRNAHDLWRMLFTLVSYVCLIVDMLTPGIHWSLIVIGGLCVLWIALLYRPQVENTLIKKRCDVLVQSSRYEGKSIVLDEAKMLCTPIVATAYPTVADQVTDGREGIVTEMNARAVAQGIVEMLEKREKRDAIVTYLASREYGNQHEVVNYMKLLDA